MLRRPTHGELSEIMSHVYLFSHVYVFLYLLNYITSLYWKLSENYKHGRRNDQPICKNKGRNESNELNSNNLRFFRNNLGLVFHTTYSYIFHSCYLLLHFPLLLPAPAFTLLHFPPVRSTPAISTPPFSALAILTVSHFSLLHFQSPQHIRLLWKTIPRYIIN